MPKRGSPGTSWMTKNQPRLSSGKSLLSTIPFAFSIVRSKPKKRRSGSISARNSGNLSSVSNCSGVRSLFADHVVAVAVVDRLLRVDHGVRIALQQLAANHQHHLFLARLHVGVRTGRRLVRAERARRLPGVNLGDVLQLFGIGWRVGVADALDFPELPEVAAAQVGRDTRARAARAPSRD